MTGGLVVALDVDGDGAHPVYQVKRVAELTASQLRAFVRDYAGASRASPGAAAGEGSGEPREIEAVRFVLVTSVCIEDREIERELDRLSR